MDRDPECGDLVSASLVDELLGKRLDDIARRLEAVEKRVGDAATSTQVEQVRSELIDHVRQVAPLAAVQDLKSWHQERDDMRSRMQRIEARLDEVEQRSS